MSFPEHITEADRRECIANLIAFMEVDKRIKARLSGSPPGAAPSQSHTVTHTATGKSKSARSPRSGQTTF